MGSRADLGPPGTVGVDLQVTTDPPPGRPQLFEITSKVNGVNLDRSFEQ